MHLQSQNTTEATRLAQEKIDELTNLDFATDPSIQITNADVLSVNVPDYFDTPATGVTRRCSVVAGPTATTRTVTVAGHRRARQSRGAHRRPDDSTQTMVTVTRTRRHGDQTPSKLGFALMELLVATFTGMIVLGAGVSLVSQVQRGYTSQLQNASIQEEARFAVDWIARELMSAGSNPYGVTVSDCPTSGTDFLTVRPDPNQDASHDDIRINADAGTPNGLLGGDTGNCGEANEDITITFDRAQRAITQRDNNIDPAPIPMTDAVITHLDFTYLDANRGVTTNPAGITFVQVEVTAQGDVMNAQTGSLDTYTARTEVRVRTR